MKRAIVAGVVALGLMGGWSTSVLAAVVVYDNFDHLATIDPNLWVGSEVGTLASDGTDGAGGTEAARDIVNSSLRMFYRAFGLTTSNAGSTDPRLNLYFRKGALITEMQARVTVTRLNVKPCANHTLPDAEPASVHAQLHGVWFNTGRAGGGSSGDVFGFVQVGRSSNDGAIHVTGVALECTDAQCSGTTGVGFENSGFKDLGTVILGQGVKIGIAWDQIGKQFLFRMGTTITPMSYTVTDAGLPSFLTRRLQIAPSIPNCMPVAGQPRPRTLMEVLWDNVKVNP